MKKQIILTLLFGAAISYGQAPQIPVTGNLGAGGSFPAINSPAVVFATDANHTMVFPEMSGSSGVVVVTSTGSLTATRNLVVPLMKGFNWQIQNATTGGQSILVIGASGTGVTIPNGATANVHSDGTNITAVTATSSLAITGACPAGGTGSCAIGTPGTAATPAAGKDILSDVTGVGWRESVNGGAMSTLCTPLNGLCGGGGGTPGGANTQVQFNNSGVFGGSANFTWNGTQLGLPLDSPQALQAGSGAADPFTTWNFVNAPTTLPASTYRLALLAQMSPILGADETTVHWSALEGLAFPGDNHNYHDLFGGQLQGFTNKSGNIGEMDGGAFGAFHAGAGTITLQIGGKVTSVAQSTGSITDNYGAQITTGNQGTGSITNNYGLDIQPNVGSGSITTNYGIHIAAQAGGATNYNLYSAGASSLNYFEGSLTSVGGYNSTGTTAGFWAAAFGSTSAAVGSCLVELTAGGVCIQAPTSGTSYLKTLVGTGSTGFPFYTYTAGSPNALVESIVGTTGSGSVVLATSPTLTTPNIGVATAAAVSGSGTATFATGAAAGTSPGTPTCTTSHVCDSMNGVVSLTMGTATTTGVLLTVTTTITRTNQANCIAQAYLAASPYTAIPVRATETTTTVVFNAGTAPTASTAYELVYYCGGK